MLRDYATLMSPIAMVSKTPGAGHVEHAANFSDVRAAAERLQSDLRDQILRSIYNREPGFFEHLVIDVLLALGYGGRRRDLAQCLGRSHDGGIDGVIAKDELGLEQVYVQAKRIRPGNAVPVNEVRDFAGSLEAKRAAKGVFVTTAHFSAPATEFCKGLTRRLALIDGQTLADLMIRYNIGVIVEMSLQFKRLDANYFRPHGLTVR